MRNPRTSITIDYKRVAIHKIQTGRQIDFRVFVIREIRGNIRSIGEYYLQCVVIFDTLLQTIISNIKPETASKVDSFVNACHRAISGLIDAADSRIRGSLHSADNLI